MDEEILTPVQVAQLLKLHLKTVYKLAEDGTIPGNRVGRNWRFKRSAILEHLRAPHAPREKKRKRNPNVDLGSTAPDDE